MSDIKNNILYVDDSLDELTNKINNNFHVLSDSNNNVKTKKGDTGKKGFDGPKGDVGDVGKNGNGSGFYRGSVPEDDVDLSNFNEWKKNDTSKYIFFNDGKIYSMDNYNYELKFFENDENEIYSFDQRTAEIFDSKGILSDKVVNKLSDDGKCIVVPRCQISDDGVFSMFYNMNGYDFDNIHKAYSKELPALFIGKTSNDVYDFSMGYAKNDEISGIKENFKIDHSKKEGGIISHDIYLCDKEGNTDGKTFYSGINLFGDSLLIGSYNYIYNEDNACDDKIPIAISFNKKFYIGVDVDENCHVSSKNVNINYDLNLINNFELLNDKISYEKNNSKYTIHGDFSIGSIDNDHTISYKNEHKSEISSTNTVNISGESVLIGVDCGFEMLNCNVKTNVTRKNNGKYFFKCDISPYWNRYEDYRIYSDGGGFSFDGKSLKLEDYNQTTKKLYYGDDLYGYIKSQGTTTTIESDSDCEWLYDNEYTFCSDMHQIISINNDEGYDKDYSDSNIDLSVNGICKIHMSDKKFGGGILLNGNIKAECKGETYMSNDTFNSKDIEISSSSLTFNIVNNSSFSVYTEGEFIFKSTDGTVEIDPTIMDYSGINSKPYYKHIKDDYLALTQKDIFGNDQGGATIYLERCGNVTYISNQKGGVINQNFYLVDEENGHRLFIEKETFFITQKGIKGSIKKTTDGLQYYVEFESDPGSDDYFLICIRNKKRKTWNYESA